MSKYKSTTYPTKVIGKKYGPHADYNHTGNFLFNIRGTNGSGKSYTARLVMDKYKLIGEKEVNGIKVLDYDLFYALGTYSSDCGGLDTVRDFYAIHPTVLELIKEKDVLMEGVLWSTVYGSAHELEAALRAGGHSMIWYGFDSNVGDCIERVLSRRASKGNMKPLKVANMLSKVAPVSHGLNHAVHFGSKVVIGDAQWIANSILTHIDREALEFNNEQVYESYSTEPFFIADYDDWEAKLTQDPEFEVSPNSDIIEQFKQKQEEAVNSLFDIFGG